MEFTKVKNFERIYEVTRCGVIRSVDHFIKNRNNSVSLKKGRVLKTQISKKGYVGCSLSKDSKRLSTSVHRVVAITFIPNPENLPQVNHKDGNKLNNHVDNLEWVSNRDNVIHAFKNNLVKLNYGENHHQCRFTNDQIREIKSRLKNGEKGSDLAKEFKISAAAMSQINKGRTYKNI